jgi:secreted trypsin-like serine protease
MARVDLKTLDREECRATFNAFWELFYKATDAILDLQMCTTGEVEGQATCRGDSGGPLVVGEDADATLIGVLAWGTSGACDNPKPDSVDFWSSLLNASNRKWVEDQLASLGQTATSSDGGSESPAPEDAGSEESPAQEDAGSEESPAPEE